MLFFFFFFIWLENRKKNIRLYVFSPIFSYFIPISFFIKDVTGTLLITKWILGLPLFQQNSNQPNIQLL